MRSKALLGEYYGVASDEWSEELLTCLVDPDCSKITVEGFDPAEAVLLYAHIIMSAGLSTSSYYITDGKVRAKTVSEVLKSLPFDVKVEVRSSDDDINDPSALILSDDYPAFFLKNNLLKNSGYSIGVTYDRCGAFISNITFAPVKVTELLLISKEETLAIVTKSKSLPGNISRLLKHKFQPLTCERIELSRKRGFEVKVSLCDVHTFSSLESVDVLIIDSHDTESWKTIAPHLVKLNKSLKIAFILPAHETLLEAMVRHLNSKA